MRFYDPKNVRMIYTTPEGKRFLIEGMSIKLVNEGRFPAALEFLRLWDADFASERRRSTALAGCVQRELNFINRREYAQREGEAPLDAEYLAFGWGARW